MDALLLPQDILNILAHSSHMQNLCNRGMGLQKTGVWETVVGGMGGKGNDAIFGDEAVVDAWEFGVRLHTVDVLASLTVLGGVINIAWCFIRTVRWNANPKFPKTE